MSDVRTTIWNDMLDAEMNVRYFGHLSRRYSQMDKWLKIFVAVCSSASVAGWQFRKGTLGSLDLTKVWHGLSAVAALAAITLPIMDFGKTIRDTSSLRSKWISIAHEYKLLWHQFGNLAEHELQTRYAHILKMEEGLAEIESGLPYKPRLVLRAQKEVVTARALSLPA